MVKLTPDYAERVYAGVLGKVIGVYLGRPFEGWSYQHIQRQLGDIEYYVHDKLDVPLIVTDDDIAGTFTFVRALEDHANNPEITPKEIGESWLNYLIKGRSVLWWGGLGQSTEHTAYPRLAGGIDAPMSGSMELTKKSEPFESLGACQGVLKLKAVVAPHSRARDVIPPIMGASGTSKPAEFPERISANNFGGKGSASDSDLSEEMSWNGSKRASRASAAAERAHVGTGQESTRRRRM